MTKKIQVVLFIFILISLFGCKTSPEVRLADSEIIKSEMLNNAIPVLEVEASEYLISVRLDTKNVSLDDTEEFKRIFDGVLEAATKNSFEEDILLIVIENLEHTFGDNAILYRRTDINSFYSGEITRQDLVQAAQYYYSYDAFPDKVTYPIKKLIEKEGYPVYTIKRGKGGANINYSSTIIIDIDASSLNIRDSESVLNLFKIIVDNSEEEYIALSLIYEQAVYVEQARREGLVLYFDGEITEDELRKYIQEVKIA